MKNNKELLDSYNWTHIEWTFGGVAFI
jgi:hypothetical protein